MNETVAAKPPEPLEQPVSPQVEKEKGEPIEEILVSEEPPSEPVKEAVNREKEDQTTSIESSTPPLVEVNPADASKKALTSLTELVAVLGLTELASTVEQDGMQALQEVRRGLAGHVSVAPRDVRIARLLRLSLRLLPAGDGDDNERARLLRELSDMVPALKRWTRRRLEARHSGSKGNFLADAVELGIALERIPGLGQRLPLEEDDWPLPSDMAGLRTEVSKLTQSVNLPSAGGVKA